jgi:hypothetical protein
VAVRAASCVGKCLIRRALAAVAGISRCDRAPHRSGIATASHAVPKRVRPMPSKPDSVEAGLR